jgi:hypothetical protein
MTESAESLEDRFSRVLSAGMSGRSAEADLAEADLRSAVVVADRVVGRVSGGRVRLELLHLAGDRGGIVYRLVLREVGRPEEYVDVFHVLPFGYPVQRGTWDPKIPGEQDTDCFVSGGELADRAALERHFVDLFGGGVLPGRLVGTLR